MTTDNFCFYLLNRLIQTNKTGGQRYSDTSPFSIPCLDHPMHLAVAFAHSCIHSLRHIAVAIAVDSIRVIIVSHIQWQHDTQHNDTQHNDLA